MRPELIPEKCPYYLRTLDKDTSVCKETTILKSAEALNSDHANNLFNWECKFVSQEVGNTGATLTNFTNAPSWATVETAATAHQVELKRMQKEQEERDRQAHLANLDAVPAAVRTGGGQLSQMAARAALATQGQQGSGPARGRGKGVAKGKGTMNPPRGGGGGAGRGSFSRSRSRNGAVATARELSAPTLQGSSEANVPSSARSEAGRSHQRSAPVTKRVATSAVAAAAAAEELQQFRQNIEPKLGPMIVCPGRKGMTGRGIKSVDLVAVFEGEDPGREVSNAHERLQLFRDKKMSIEQSVEEEFIETVVAAKLWMPLVLASARTGEQLTAWTTVSRNMAEFKMPLGQRLGFNKKRIVEFSGERNWKAYVAGLTPDADQDGRTWTPHAPRFGPIDEDNEDQKKAYTQHWTEAALSNGLMQVLWDAEPDSWTDFKKLSDIWFESKGLTAIMQQSKFFHDLISPVHTLICAVRSALDHYPGRFGMNLSDVLYVFPTEGLSMPFQAKTFADEVYGGRVFLRSLHKNTKLLEAIVVCKQYAGGEAQLSASFVETEEKLLGYRSTLLGEITPQQLGEIMTFMESYKVYRDTSFKRLRPKAFTLHLDPVALQIGRSLWGIYQKNMEQGRSQDNPINFLRKAHEMFTGIKDAEGLLTLLSNRIAELNERSFTSGLEQAMSVPLIQLSDCGLLHDALKAAEGIAKSKEQLDAIRGVSERVFLILPACVDVSQLTFEDINYPCKLLKAVKEQKGVLDESNPDLGRIVDRLSSLLNELAHWRIDVESIRKDFQPTKPDVSSFLEHRDALDKHICIEVNEKGDGPGLKAMQDISLPSIYTVIA